jgi:hypothetical protein
VLALGEVSLERRNLFRAEPRDEGRDLRRILPRRDRELARPLEKDLARLVRNRAQPVGRDVPLDFQTSSIGASSTAESSM